MPQPWRKILLPLVVLFVFVAACKKQYSSDAPLTPTYAPSIITNSDNQILYGINPSTGVKNWQYTLSSAPAAPLGAFAPSPLLYHEMIYIASTYGGSSTDTILKINSETGKLVAKFYFLQYGVGNRQLQMGTPIAAGNLIYVPLGDTLYAIDTTAGKTQWKYSPGANSNTLSANYNGTPLNSSLMISSPTIYKDTLYGATVDGIVFALATTQSPSSVGAAVSAAWTYNGTSTSFLSSPAVSAPYLYIGGMDSNMYCIPLQAADGASTNSPRWTYHTHGSIVSSPTAQDGVCVFGSYDFNVYCLDTFLVGAEPTPRWITPTSSYVYSSPTLVNNVVYIGSYDYFLYALNIADGGVKWRYKTTALIKSSPLVYGGLVYIGSYDKNLYALDTSLGTQRWIYNTNGQIGCSPVIDDLSGNEYNSQISGFTN